jgi:UDPglucose 6-dehydrogenase
MRVSIIGSGYVGLVAAACIAEMGNSVYCMDINVDKIKQLNEGIIPIYEPGLENLVKNNLKNGNLRFTTEMAVALENAQICFIAVGTPMGEDGSADLQFVLSCAKNIGSHMNGPLIIVDKSTVPVGTAEKVQKTVAEMLEKRKVTHEFHVVSNPEFLKEGAAIKDFMSPDRVVIGADDAGALEKMRELYRPFLLNHEKILAMDVRSAEMTKYAANAMLATKISFINEMANICDRVGADVNKVRLGIGSDTRIGYSFLYPGCGYGGSCFPKDVRALERTAKDYGYTPRILSAVQSVNDAQKLVVVEKIIKEFGSDLSKFCFAIWGLSFKPETDDMREAPSLTVIHELTKHGARIKAYDPKAIEEAKSHYLKSNTKVEYCSSKYEALKDADALILLTEWKEFRSPDFDEIRKQLKQKTIFDGRNQYDKKRVIEYGLNYHSM